MLFKRFVHATTRAEQQEQHESWAPLLSKGSFGLVDVGREAFNAAFQSATVPIIRRECGGCGAAHSDIYYKRLTSPHTFAAYAYMAYNWFSSENTFHSDFELYSSLDDALNGVNEWSYCNFNDGGVGFLRDCGPNGAVGGQWNSCNGWSDCPNPRGGQDDVRFSILGELILPSICL